MGEIGFGSPKKTLALADGKRIGGLIEIGARLDLDEGDHRAAPRDDVDLAPPAGSGGKAALENPVALQAQQQNCDLFGPRPERQSPQFTSSYHAAKLGPRGYAFNGNN